MPGLGNENGKLRWGERETTRAYEHREGMHRKREEDGHRYGEIRGRGARRHAVGGMKGSMEKVKKPKPARKGP